MSLFDGDNLIEIDLYYTFKESEIGKRLIILEEDRAKAILEGKEEEYERKAEEERRKEATKNIMMLKTKVEKDVATKVEEERVKKPREKINKDKVEILKTKWAPMTWGEQNQIMIQSTPNDAHGQPQLNFVLYQSNIIKICLKEWNAISQGQKVPVTSEAIGRLDHRVIERLFQKFDGYINFTEEERGK